LVSERKLTSPFLARFSFHHHHHRFDSNTRHSTLDTSRKAALKQAKANREAALAARIKRDQDRKDRELREIRRGVEAIKKALDALPPKVRIEVRRRRGFRFGSVKGS
jgi:hypothetical protein